MTILNPIATSSPLLQATSTQVTSQVERQAGLRLEQIVRATVVESGLDRVLLEMNHRHYQTQSDQQLQVGQKLTLQVLQTHPQLEFRVINDPVGDKLSQLLPLLSRAYDWPKLIDTLQQQPSPKGLPQTMPQLLTQLRQLLQPGSPAPKQLDAAFSKLSSQLRQFMPPAVVATQVAVSAPLPVVDTGFSVPGLPERDQQAALLPLVRNLLSQLAQLPQKPVQPMSQDWQAQTLKLLTPLAQQAELPEMLLPQQLRELTSQLGRLQQSPQLPAKMQVAVEKLLLQITSQQNRPSGQPQSPPAIQQRVVADPLSPGVPAARVVPPQGQANVAPPQFAREVPADPLSYRAPAVRSVPRSGLSAPMPPPIRGESAAGPVYSRAPVMGMGPQGEAVPPAVPVTQPAAKAVAGNLASDIVTGAEKVVAQLQQMQPHEKGLSPELLGKVEGVLQNLQLAKQQPQIAASLLPGLALVTHQLTDLLQAPPLLPRGELLGLLSQLFGFHLEAELLNGKQKAALASLKLQLLAMQSDSADEVKEPLQRLELFQLCRAKLAEENVQFLPLPFSELEEGYLLAEQRPEKEEDDQATAPLQLSMSLRLSALGNLQVDMLLDQQGLHLRIAGEDSEKMNYLQGATAELKESITGLPLQGVSFGADAQQPSRRLIEHLLPEALGMLDARI